MLDEETSPQWAADRSSRRHGADARGARPGPALIGLDEKELDVARPRPMKCPATPPLHPLARALVAKTSVPVAPALALLHAREELRQVLLVRGEQFLAHLFGDRA